MARPIILITGAAALVALIVGLAVSLWPAGDVAESPSPAVSPGGFDASHAAVAGAADEHAPSADPRGAFGIGPEPVARSPEEPGPSRAAPAEPGTAIGPSPPPTAPPPGVADDF